MSQNTFRNVKQEAIIWANSNAYLCHHMASLGHTRLPQSYVDTIAAT